MDTPQHPVAFAARNISKTFGPVVALSDASIELRGGEVTALMGENGAGKSTLLKIINGDYQPSTGTLELEGEPARFRDPAHAHAAGVRVVAQEPEIIAHVSVAENIYVGALGRSGLRFRARLLERRAADDLERFGFADTVDPLELGKNLTAAQRQVVEIMRAVVSEPKVICFDEPTSSLGEEEVGILFSLIDGLRQKGVAVAYVSHRLREVFTLADRVTVLRDGRLVGTRAIADTNNDDLVRMMVGRDLSQLFRRSARATGATVLQLTAVTTDDVRDIDLTVRAGEVVGIAGLVGAGRTELLRAIIGDLPIRSGELRVSGEVVKFASPADSVAAGIGFAPEERKAEALIMQRTVRDNTVLAILWRIAKGFIVRSSTERSITTDYITRLNIRTNSTEQLVKNLSGGNQQKVVLARWLATHPHLLILDEPTRGVDVGAKAEIYRVIDELAEHGTAILMVSSELPEVLGVSDRIYVMNAGRLSPSIAQSDATEESILAIALAEPTPTSPHQN